MTESHAVSMARFLVLEASRILSQTPCSLHSVAVDAVEKGVTTTIDEAIVAIRALSRMFVYAVVLEREGRMGHFLVYYQVEPLAIFANIKLDSTKVTLTEFTTTNLVKANTALESLFTQIRVMTAAPTALERLRIQHILQQCPEAPLTDICGSESHLKCIAEGKSACNNKIHFERVVHAHTDPSLGDCSYLDTCFKWRQCKFVHYKVVYPENFTPHSRAKQSPQNAPQFINADLLHLDLTALGNDYAAMIIDPPWEIHTNPGSSNGCTDEKLLGLNVGALQTSGLVFLWVTGRVLDLGRQCLTKWGYTHVEELIWLKTNQLGRTICTGRTGHWLNHTKEHVLVGTKNAALNIPRALDVDVLVSSALGRSQKPDELYAMIDRLVGPDAKKIELFGRKTNVRPGWLTIGNEMGHTHVHDPKLKEQLRLP